MQSDKDTRYFVMGNLVEIGYKTNFTVVWQTRTGENVKGLICVGVHNIDMYMLSGKSLELLWTKHLASKIEIVKPLYSHQGLHSNSILVYDTDTMLKIYSVNEQGCEFMAQQEITSNLLMVDMIINEKGETVILTDYEKELCILKLNLQKKTIKISKVFNFFSPLNFMKIVFVDMETVSMFASLNDNADSFYFFIVDSEHETLDPSPKYSHLSLSAFRDLNILEVLDCVIDAGHMMILLSDQIVLYSFQDQAIKGKLKFKASEQGKIIVFNALMNEYFLSLKYMGNTKSKLLSFKCNIGSQIIPMSSVEFEEIYLVEEIMPDSFITVYDRNTLIITNFNHKCNMAFVYHNNAKIKLNLEEFSKGMPQFDSLHISKNKIMVHSTENMEAYVLDNSIKSTTLANINIPKNSALKKVETGEYLSNKFIVLVFNRYLHFESYNDQSGFEFMRRIPTSSNIIDTFMIDSSRIIIALETDILIYNIESNETHKIYATSFSRSGITNLRCKHGFVFFITDENVLNSLPLKLETNPIQPRQSAFPEQVSTIHLCDDGVIISFWLSNKIVVVNFDLTLVRIITSKKNNINDLFMLKAGESIHPIIPLNHIDAGTKDQIDEDYLFIAFKDGSLEIIKLPTQESIAYFVLDNNAITFKVLDIEGRNSMFLQTANSLVTYNCQKKEFETFMFRNKHYRYTNFFDYHNTVIQYTCDKFKLIEFADTKLRNQITIKTPSFAKNPVLHLKTFGNSLFYISADKDQRRCYLIVHNIATKSESCKVELPFIQPCELLVFSHKGDTMILITKITNSISHLLIYRLNSISVDKEAGHSHDLENVYACEREGKLENFNFIAEMSTLLNIRVVTTLGFYIKKKSYCIDLHSISTRGLRRIGGEVQRSIELKKEEPIKTQSYPQSLKVKGEYIIFVSFSTFNVLKYHPSERKHYLRGKYSDQEFITDCDFIEKELYMISNSDRYVKILKHRTVSNHTDYFSVDCVSQIRLTDVIERLYCDLNLMVSTDNTIYRYMEIDEDAFNLIKRAATGFAESKGGIVLTRKMKNLQNENSRQSKLTTYLFSAFNLEEFDDSDINYLLDVAANDKEFVNRYSWTFAKTEQVKRIINCFKGCN